ncbi:nuclear transport factor 2 family protein [Gordonia oryzae]|uniref:Nuclear transport factor 2 family protein n=1 Tax=Gordonia oryzae TaxID=2487349 RepID=A0A3N4G3F7_9ACTN|nr:nuclear transport factor 2 family protein [Gordonia oryzae]RPA57442.1 nuclear transport factor 2 family protein [Gordonia oryzae]
MNDAAAITALKYRYLRALDTKDWDTFADTLTDDVTGEYGDSLSFTTRDELVGFMRTSVGPGVITEHHVSHPEIEVSGDVAHGRWYLSDRVIVPDFEFMLIGAAFYDDTYRRTGRGWRICATGYDRTYEAHVPLAAIPGFTLKVGPAIRAGK